MADLMKMAEEFRAAKTKAEADEIYAQMKEIAECEEEIDAFLWVAYDCPDGI